MQFLSRGNVFSHSFAAFVHRLTHLNYINLVFLGDRDRERVSVRKIEIAGETDKISHVIHLVVKQNILVFIKNHRNKGVSPHRLIRDTSLSVKIWNTPAVFETLDNP